MHDIKALENKWLAYQAKKRKPWYFISLLGIFFILFLFFIIYKSNLQFNLSKYFNNTTKSSKGFLSSLNKNENQLVLVNPALTRLETTDVYSLDKIIIPATTNSESKNIQSSDLLVDIPILDNENESAAKETFTSKNHKRKNHLDIIETSSLSAYKDVETRFYQSHDIDDALFLAKSYYKRANYKKAIHWAYETNKLDGKLEESFLIFVKSKMKLGQKNEAVSILNQYLRHSNSNNARALLTQIINNKFN